MKKCMKEKQNSTSGEDVQFSVILVPPQDTVVTKERFQILARIRTIDIIKITRNTESALDMQMPFLKKFFHQEFLIFFFIFRFIHCILSISVLPALICITISVYACLMPTSVRRGIRSPATGAMDGCEPPCECWQSNPGFNFLLSHSCEKERQTEFM